MRYYPAVGPAIPHSKAGCSRVTHPFAGDGLLRPLDLHVLSTPPAFVLSQDQTLQEEFNQLSRTAHNTHYWTIMRRSGIIIKSEFNLSRGPLQAVAQTRSPRTFASLDSIFNQQPRRFGGSLEGYPLKQGPSSPSRRLACPLSRVRAARTARGCESRRNRAQMQPSAHPTSPAHARQSPHATQHVRGDDTAS